MCLDPTGSEVGTSLGPTQGRPPPHNKGTLQSWKEHCRGVSWHKTKAHRRLHDPGNGAGRLWGGMSHAGHIRSLVSHLIPGHSLLFPGREDLSILPLPYLPPTPPTNCQIHRLLPLVGASA